MSRRTANRFPAAPAQEALRTFARAHALPLHGLGAVIGLDQRLVTSTMNRRWLPWHVADAVAVALQRHPCDLWPDWFPLPRRRQFAFVAADHANYTGGNDND